MLRAFTSMFHSAEASEATAAAPSAAAPLQLTLRMHSAADSSQPAAAASEPQSSARTPMTDSKIKHESTAAVVRVKREADSSSGNGESTAAAASVASAAAASHAPPVAAASAGPQLTPAACCERATSAIGRMLRHSQNAAWKQQLLTALGASDADAVEVALQAGLLQLLAESSQQQQVAPTVKTQQASIDGQARVKKEESDIVEPAVKRQKHAKRESDPPASSLQSQHPARNSLRADSKDDDGSEDAACICTHVSKMVRPAAIRAELKNLPKLVKSQLWFCGTCGETRSNPSHFSKKHAVGCDVLPMTWHCFQCKTDVNEGNVDSRGAGKLKQVVALVKKKNPKAQPAEQRDSL